MTVKDIYSVIKNANLIKKWPGEYRVYSDTDIVFIYCDASGRPVSFMYETTGVRYPISVADSKTVTALLNNRYARLTRTIVRSAAAVKSK